MLRIPFRARDGSARGPTRREIKELGLSQEIVRMGASDRLWWVYYRKSVQPRDIAPRPWMVKTLLTHRLELGQLMAVGRSKNF